MTRDEQLRKEQRERDEQLQKEQRERDEQLRKDFQQMVPRNYSYKKTENYSNTYLSGKDKECICGKIFFKLKLSNIQLDKAPLIDCSSTTKIFDIFFN